MPAVIKLLEYEVAPNVTEHMYKKYVKTAKTHEGHWDKDERRHDYEAYSYTQLCDMNDKNNAKIDKAFAKYEAVLKEYERDNTILDYCIRRKKSATVEKLSFWSISKLV